MKRLVLALLAVAIVQAVAARAADAQDAEAKYQAMLAAAKADPAATDWQALRFAVLFTIRRTWRPQGDACGTRGP